MAYIFQPARSELHEQIRRHATAIRGRVLDVGSGPGSRYKGLFRFDEYVKMDLDGVNGIDAAGSAEAIPFSAASFDSIVCSQVLGDVYDVPKAFREFYRVLKPGGAALITEALFDSMHDEPHDYWRFTKNSFRRLAEEAGFLVEALEQRGGFWSIRSQMLIRYLINRFDLYRAWYGRLADILIRIYAKSMMWFDRRDHSEASRIFTHGYILVMRKPL